MNRFAGLAPISLISINFFFESGVSVFNILGLFS